MSGMKGISDGLKLDKEREAWLQNWLSLFGAWVYSGRLEKRQGSMIAQFMATVERRDYPGRPVCSDDDGLLINEVVKLIYHLDTEAFDMLLSRYVYCASDRAIARAQHGKYRLRDIVARKGGLPAKKVPSISTCRREVDEILKAVEYLLYQPLTDAFKSREKEKIVKRNSKNMLTFLNQ
ncbi:antiterminator Q family protein [Morganella psychrotolerans]|uniref:Antiterminator n=1 Tax=Morganella psychrotolerans TaxID=368603 RepID=A0A1B8HKN8_9GAMM|nr:antiterminator Q family protein [Morganella psychrotolerans]OBU09839.1 antiterminator [Morganella psychrotolerans]